MPVSEDGELLERLTGANWNLGYVEGAGHLIITTDDCHRNWRLHRAAGKQSSGGLPEVGHLAAGTAIKSCLRIRTFCYTLIRNLS